MSRGGPTGGLPKSGQREADAPAFGPPPPPTSEHVTAAHEGKQRQKRWAAKVTTGCKTCRARHIKCDEAKPFCKACTSRGRWCEGYNSYPPLQPSDYACAPLRPKRDGTAPVSPVAVRSREVMCKEKLARPFEATVLPEPQPPGWDVAEGLRYLFCIMAPEYLENSLGNSDYESQFVGPPTVIVEHSFLMVVTAHRIMTACRQRGVLPSPDQLPSLKQVWNRFYFHMGCSLDKVNRQIASPEPDTGVFYRIMDILHVELTLLSLTWRPHIEGCATLLHLYGGVQRVLDLSIGKPSPILAIQLILIIATMANTTSPAANQIRGFTDWTTAEICTVYPTTVYSEMPCPTHLFLNIRQINQLRVQAAGRASYRDVIWPTAREVFADIERFDPENWTEPYTVPKKPGMDLVARIFKTAVALYGMLVIPPPASTESPSRDGIISPHFENTTPASYGGLKMSFRMRLLRLVCTAMETRPVKLYLAWPLAVLGVALADGQATEREMVEDYLQKISRAPQTYCGPTTSLVKLRAFWASGKTQWEQCFDEPCPVLA